MSSLLEKRYVIILISLIWGFALSFLFRKAFGTGQCSVVQAPLDLQDLNEVIHENNRCYKLTRYPTSCSN